MPWREFDKRNQTIILKGGRPMKKSKDILEASDFAFKNGMIHADSEYPYVSFCIEFTTNQLLETKRAMKDNHATTRNSL